LRRLPVDRFKIPNIANDKPRQPHQPRLEPHRHDDVATRAARRLCNEATAAGIGKM
jgi:hypothetical protein